MWQQTLITLRARPRGFHLVTDELLAGLPELKACRVGLLHLWLQHTSASLTINENADPAARLRASSRIWAGAVSGLPAWNGGAGAYS
ncbi:YjbQ family protein, partial [Pseudomonas sp. NPDC089569]|uniref:YjbQ family protein n=1 Tax=Pseudomonas sp. NPDC089569 TaxID=3390722 RepID=UPI003D01D6A8